MLYFSQLFYCLLNMRYLKENEKAIHLYRTFGFKEEGRLIQEYFSNGTYHDVLRMYILQEEFVSKIT